MSQRSAKQRWLFRFIAVLLGLSPLLITELILRVAGTEFEPTRSDPFVEFTSVTPLFELNAADDTYVIRQARQPFFKPDSFAARKADNEFRIFCLGGSTVQGNPYSIETSFTTWLELGLQAADPQRQWQVVNCGGISYASYRLAPILDECLNYEPDLFVIYTGQNEFLEDRTYGHLKRSPDALRWLSKIRTFQVARQWWNSINEDTAKEQGNSSAKISGEVEALLDYRGGLEQYHRDDAWRSEVVEHFSATLEVMIQKAKSAGIPVILADPVCNLKDCAPFKIQFSDHVSPEDRSHIEEAIRTGDGDTLDEDQRIAILEAATAIDPRHAGVWYELGKEYLRANRDDEAYQAFVRAKDEDVCPLRIIEPLRDAIRHVASKTSTRVVPVMERISSESPDGIPGDEMLLDHVHPSISSHQLIAEMFLEVMKDEGFVAIDLDWKVRQKELYRKHLATLDTPYYARGQEHLEGLRKWAQGRVQKLREDRGAER